MENKSGIRVSPCRGLSQFRDMRNATQLASTCPRVELLENTCTQLPTQSCARCATPKPPTFPSEFKKPRAFSSFWKNASDSTLQEKEKEEADTEAKMYSSTVQLAPLSRMAPRNNVMIPSLQASFRRKRAAKRPPDDPLDDLFQLNPARIQRRRQ